MSPSKTRILLVDDHEPAVKISGAFLRELGYEYDVARSGSEALEKTFSAPYGLVLMDIQMPGMDGLETARRIRAEEKERGTPPLPIVGMTGNATRDDRLFCLRAGMNYCLFKPFRLKELEAVLEGMRS